MTFEETDETFDFEAKKFAKVDPSLLRESESTDKDQNIRKINALTDYISMKEVIEQQIEAEQGAVDDKVLYMVRKSAPNVDGVNRV